MMQTEQSEYTMESEEVKPITIAANFSEMNSEISERVEQQFQKEYYIVQALFNVRDNRECLHVPRTLPEWRDKLYIVENYSK